MKVLLPTRLPSLVAILTLGCRTTQYKCVCCRPNSFSLLKLNLLVDGKVLAEVYNAFQKYFVTKETRNVFQSDFIEIFFVSTNF